jgi:transposase
MHYVEGLNRNQLTLFPEALDDYISQYNPVRFLDAFVETLNIEALGFKHAILSKTGRPPYHPGALLRLYIYGYLNRLRSSRMLEREAHRNVEVMWLLRRLTPDFKTIADFRKDNREAICQVCREFTFYCRELGLFGVNSRGRNYTKRQLKRVIQELDKKIESYLEELDEADEEEPEKRNVTAEEL